MSTNVLVSSDATGNAGVASVDMKLEVVVILVSMTAQKSSTRGWGGGFDADRAVGSDFRLVQFTPGVRQLS